MIASLVDRARTLAPDLARHRASHDANRRLDPEVVTALRAGSRVRVRMAEAPVLLVRVGPEGYFQRMRQKLHWGDLTDRSPL